jgi:hypothetical protein
LHADKSTARCPTCPQQGHHSMLCVCFSCVMFYVLFHAFLDCGAGLLQLLMHTQVCGR